MRLSRQMRSTLYHHDMTESAMAGGVMKMVSKERMSAAMDTLISERYATGFGGAAVGSQSS